MRECLRVLRPGGRLAGYVIHTPPGLPDEGAARAVELVPMEVLADAQPAEMTADAGFQAVRSRDVTADFRATCGAIIEALAKHEAAARAADGDEMYEDNVRRKNGVLTAINEGLIVRSLVVGTRA